MHVQIGARTHNFADPTGLLSDCHRRIEMFLSVLETVAAVVDRPVTEETRRALESALHYFAQAAPKHTADEEESLFPRLRQIHDLEMRSVLSKVQQLEEEHHWAAPLHAEVERLGVRYLSMDGLSNTEAEEVRKAIASLASMYERHIHTEDELIFPLAARMLSETDKSAIANEMAGRRNVKVVTAITEFRK